MNSEGRITDAQEANMTLEEEMLEAKSMGAVRQACIAASIVSTQFVQMMPYGAGIVGALDIGSQLGATPAQSAWIASSYPLTQGAFVLIGGRFGSVYGHKNVLALAGIWWVIFHLATGFMESLPSLCAFRALSGIGGAMIVPNAIALITITFPPGKMRNISVGLFASTTPVGYTLGCVSTGFFVQLLPWKWEFFFLAMFGAVVFAIFILVVPGEEAPLEQGGHVDYVGAYLAVAALILFNFVWNQAPVVGWDTPYQYILLIVSFLHLAAFLLWSRYAAEPILPLNIWSAPSFGPMLLSVFFAFMSIGIFIWYLTVWQITLRHYSLFLNAATYVAFAVLGLAAAFLSAKLIRLLPAEYLIVMGAVGSCIATILLATAPAQQTFWAQAFPALLCLALDPDFLFTAAQIIASNAVKRRQQGAAGSLIGTVFGYGLSIGLGFAGTVEKYTNHSSQVQDYRNALYSGIGMAGAAAVIALFFVRMPKDIREGWDKEDQPNPTSRMQGS